MVHVKVCGVVTAEDAEACARAGASAIGINLVPSSRRYVEVEAGREIARAIRRAESASPRATKVLVVGVVADLALPQIRALVSDAELDCVQLHGDEPPELVSALLPHAYKAARIASADDVARARAHPGDHLLVDAKVDGALGGTGTSFDWNLVVDLARERRLTLAGGLDPDNVAEAVRIVRPYCVDVASGVELTGAPGRKDLAKVAAFIDAARRA